MSVATMLQRVRGHRYRVVAHAAGRTIPTEWFRTFDEARAYADELARNSGVICVVFLTGCEDPAYVAPLNARPGGDEGTERGGMGGVREPRRPRPGAAPDAIALELPD